MFQLDMTGLSIRLLALSVLSLAITNGQPIYPRPPPSPPSTCSPCNQPEYSNIAQISVYCCHNNFTSQTDPITCADGQGPWRNPNACNISAFYPPPPAISPSPPKSYPPPPAQSPPPPSPPPACPGECSGMINVTSEGSVHSYYCCGNFFMISDGCLTCTSKEGPTYGPFIDPVCSLPASEEHCGSDTRALARTAFTFLSVLISLLGAYYLL